MWVEGHAACAAAAERLLLRCTKPDACLSSHAPELRPPPAPPPRPPPQFTFLMDDVGVPLNYRHMEGFGVHTFVLVNRQGRETLVKFHWKPTCGEAELDLT